MEVHWVDGQIVPKSRGTNPIKTIPNQISQTIDRYTSERRTESSRHDADAQTAFLTAAAEPVGHALMFFVAADDEMEGVGVVVDYEGLFAGKGKDLY